MHIIPKRNTLKLAKIVSEIQASHSARLINLESNDSIIKFLVGEIANHNDKEYLGTATASNANITPVIAPVDSRGYHSHCVFLSAELHAEIGALPMCRPPVPPIHADTWS